MQTAIAFGGHGNNLLTTGKTTQDGASRLDDIRRLSLRYRRSFDVLASADFVVGTHFGGLTFWDALKNCGWERNTCLYQPLKVGIDLAFLRALEDEMNLPLKEIAQFGIGLSLGEITALASAQTWHSVETTLHLVVRRGELILEHQPNGEQMTTWAFIRCGWDKAVEAVHRIQARFSSHGTTLALTNNNATEIVLIAGEETALESVVNELKESGTRVAINKNLNLGAVFHHPSLKDAAYPFLQAVYESGPVASVIPILSNVTGQPHVLEELALQLGNHLWHPVQFTRCTDYLKREGVERVIVIGGGAVANLLQASFGKDRVVVFDCLEDIKRAQSLFGR